MARLDWQQITSPNFGSVNDALQLAGESLNRGLAQFKGTFEGIDAQQRDAESNRLMADVLRLQDPAAIRGALADGSLFAGRDVTRLSPDAIRFAQGATGVILRDQGTAAGTDLTRSQTANNAFNLDRAQIQAGRDDQRYNAREALRPVENQITQLYNNGQVTEAQALAGQYSDAFAEAGIDIGTVFSAGESRFGAAVQQDRLAEDQRQWVDGVTRNQSADEVFRSLLGTTNDPMVASQYVRQAVQDGRIDPKLGNEVLARLGNTDLFSNNGQVDDALRQMGVPVPGLRDPNGTRLPEAPGMFPNVPGVSEGYISNIRNTESGGRYTARNNAMGAGGVRGHYGIDQIGHARLQDAINAGIAPKGTTTEQFANDPALQEKVGAWHWNDLARQYDTSGASRYEGQVINGVPINRETFMSMAQLGGAGGARRFIESGGQYNPSDGNFTLSEYALKHYGDNGASAPSYGNSVRSAPVTELLGRGGLLNMGVEIPAGAPQVPVTPGPAGNNAADLISQVANQTGVPVVNGPVAPSGGNAVVLAQGAEDAPSAPATPVPVAAPGAEQAQAALDAAMQSARGPNGERWEDDTALRRKAEENVGPADTRPRGLTEMRGRMFTELGVDDPNQRENYNAQVQRQAAKVDAEFARLVNERNKMFPDVAAQQQETVRLTVDPQSLGETSQATSVANRAFDGVRQNILGEIAQLDPTSFNGTVSEADVLSQLTSGDKALPGNVPAGEVARYLTELTDTAGEYGMDPRVAGAIIRNSLGSETGWWPFSDRKTTVDYDRMRATADSLFPKDANGNRNVNQVVGELVRESRSQKGAVSVRQATEAIAMLTADIDRRIQDARAAGDEQLVKALLTEKAMIESQARLRMEQLANQSQLGIR